MHKVNRIGNTNQFEKTTIKKVVALIRTYQEEEYSILVEVFTIGVTVTARKKEDEKTIINYICHENKERRRFINALLDYKEETTLNSTINVEIF